MNTFKTGGSALFLALFLTIASFGATLTGVEVSKSYAAVGNRGCTVSGATVATPSVVTCSAAHRLADGDPIQIINVGGTTTVNTTGYAKITGYSSTTFGFYSDAALSTGITGTGAYTSGGTVSAAFDISAITTDWTLRIRVDSLTASKKVLISVQDSVDGFATFQNLAVINPTGSVGTNGSTVDYSFRSYQLPSARFGTSNARLRVSVQSIDGSATLVTSVFVEQ